MNIPLVTPEMRQQFDTLGYLVVNDVIDEAALDAVTADFAAKLDEMIRTWQAEGVLAEAYAGLPFCERLVKVAANSSVNWGRRFDISLPQSGVAPDTPFHASKAVFNLLTHPRLLDLAETFVGPEIYSNPIQHTRIKPPERLLSGKKLDGLTAKTGWHQDQGVANPEQDNVPVLTVWLAITDADTENGCLCVIPGSHHGELTPHCPGIGLGGGLEIPEKLITKKPVAVPVRRGGALLLHRRTQHASLVNRSDRIRWSFDLRYQPTGLPTGRPAFPGFIARSRRNPGSALQDWR